MKEKTPFSCEAFGLPFFIFQGSDGEKPWALARVGIAILYSTMKYNPRV